MCAPIPIHIPLSIANEPVATPYRVRGRATSASFRPTYTVPFNTTSPFANWRNHLLALVPHSSTLRSFTSHLPPLSNQEYQNQGHTDIPPPRNHSPQRSTNPPATNHVAHQEYIVRATSRVEPLLQALHHRFHSPRFDILCHCRLCHHSCPRCQRHFRSQQCPVSFRQRSLWQYSHWFKPWFCHLPPGSVTPSDDLYGEPRRVPLPGVSRAPTTSGVPGPGAYGHIPSGSVTPPSEGPLARTVMPRSRHVTRSDGKGCPRTWGLRSYPSTFR